MRGGVDSGEPDFCSRKAIVVDMWNISTGDGSQPSPGAVGLGAAAQRETPAAHTSCHDWPKAGGGETMGLGLRKRRDENHMRIALYILTPYLFSLPHRSGTYIDFVQPDVVDN